MPSRRRTVPLTASLWRTLGPSEDDAAELNMGTEKRPTGSEAAVSIELGDPTQASGLPAGLPTHEIQT